MSDPRITTAQAVELLAGATPGPWRGDRYDGTVKYHILAGAEGSEVAVLTVDHKNGIYGFGCGEECGYPVSPSGEADERLVLAAPDLAADLIDARATIDALRAELKAARELRGIVVARDHARAVRAAYIEGLCDAEVAAHLDAQRAWRRSAVIGDLEATLTRCGLTDAERVADGEVDDG